MHALYAGSPSLERTFATSVLRVFRPHPSVVASQLEGDFTAEVAEAFIRSADDALKRPGFIGLHDWTGVTSFDTTVPPRMAAWTLPRIGNVAHLVIATEHPMVSMAVRVTNLTLKRIQHVDSRAALAAYVDRVLTPAFAPR